MSIELIVACAETTDGKLVIGNNGMIPWKISEDLKMFNRKTIGHTVVMGRKTYESLPIKPLPGRDNIIFSTNPKFIAPDCTITSQRIPILRKFRNSYEKCFIIGGEHIYKLFVPWADRVHLSKIEGIFSGDTFFPIPIEQLQKEWIMISAEQHPAKNGSPEWREYVYGRGFSKT